ncbi:beta strand repeat-containing protein, partial [Methanobrevibacter filiformis]|uniref:beta strand repeat-containing protein n=1 Tax=Methanobrevibacter filiformis TaxID=55758 RepID=UPI0014722574
DVNYTAAVNSTEFGGVLINTTLVINLVPDSKVNSSVSVNGTLKDEYGDNVSGVTVIVTVDGFNYTSTTDSNGDWNITYLVNSSSEISVVATFVGDVNYTAAVNSTEFGGVLINTTLVINLVPDSKVNSSVSVNGTLRDEYGNNVSGVTVIVTINGISYNSTADGEGNWNITYIVNSSDPVNVVAVFVGDVNYAAAANSTVFDGVLINTILVINLVPNSKVNSSVNINGTLKDEYNGSVSNMVVVVAVNGASYTSITDSNGDWNITYLVNSSSEISVVATFIGDVNYTAAVNSTEFGGVLINTTLVINSVPDSKVNSSVSVNGTLKDEYGDNVSGATVIVTVDGFNYTSITDSNGNWNITYLVNSSSEISVVATFIGDVNYTAAVNSTEFGGVLINTTLVINPVPDSKVNSSVSVNGTLKDEYGDNVSGVTVIVTVDGFNYTSTTDSNGNWNITYLVNSSSEISVVATFIGDVNYTAAVNSTEFGGVLINTILVINSVPDSKVNSSVSVNGTLKDEYGDNVSGVTVIVTVDGFNYTSTTDSNGNWNITYIVNSSSEINVIATFIGDVNYTAAVNSTEFGGVLINTTLVINLVPDSKVNSSVSVNGTLRDEYGDNVSGVTVIVTVDGFNYTSTTDSNGDWNITYLVNSSSEISVVATFAGDVNYTAAVNSTEFAGVLINTTLVINPVPDSKVNSSVSVNGTLKDEYGDNVSGVTVIVTVDGFNYTSTTDSNGNWNITYIVNSSSEISVVATFIGDVNYTAAVNNTEFAGVLINTTLVINPVPDSKVNSSVSVNGTLKDEYGDNVSGVTVIVTVDGFNYTSTTDSNGNWNITYLVNSSSEINLIATFIGDVNYTAAANSTDFGGVLINTTLVINPVPDSKVNSSVSVNGTLKDEYGNNVSGVTVIVTVDGFNYTSTTDSNGNWNITYIVNSSSEINVIATFIGDVNYTAAANNTEFAGVLINTTLVINPVPDSKVNSSVSVNGTLKDEYGDNVSGVTVIVTVDGFNYTSTTDSNGNWNITYIVNSSSEINVIATFIGDVNYTAAVNNTEFGGVLINTTLVINSVPDSKVNSSVSVNGTLRDEYGDNVSGVTVIVTVDGFNYTSTTDSNGNWNITYLVNSSSEISVVATFAGDVNYAAAVNNTEFGGVLINTTLVINPVPNSKVNSSVNVNGTLKDEYGDNVSGATVIVTVDGFNYTSTTDSNGDWNITYLVNSSSEISVVATFIGDVNYAAAVNSTEFGGVLINTTLVINSVPDSKVNSSVSVNGTLRDEYGDNVSGVTVIVTVDGFNYTSTTDSNGDWNITYLVNSSSEISVVATFVGDVNYTAAVNSTEFGGVLINTTLVINSVPDSKVNSSVSVNGTLRDEYGDNVSGVTVIVTVDGFNYTSITDSNGDWNITYLVNSSSEISVVATFVGDVNYTAAVNSTEFGGVLINTTLVINPVPDSKVNSSVSVNGTLKDEYGDNVSGVTVIVTVDGFNYTSTTDSNGDWNITYLVNSSSEISVVATFIGDVNYTAAVNSTEFGGVLINTTLVINSVPDSKVNSSVSVNGTLKDEYGDNVSGVTVIVTVDGFNYTSTTDSNGDWNITYLVNSSSEISVIATFDGDVNYTAAANSTEFGGVLINTTLVINLVPDSKVNSSVSVNGTLKDEYGDNVSGVTVIVTVDGFNYTSITDSNGDWNITYLVNSSSEISVVATFVGDVNYTAAVNSTEFGGVLINTTLVINPVPDSKVNSSVSVNGTLKDEYGDNVSGVTVIVTVDGFNYTSTTDSNGDWNITYLVNSSSEISVVATFIGDVNYTAAVNSTEFGGVLINTILVINSVPDSKVNSSVSVNGTLKDEYGDNVSGVTVIVTV